MFVEFCPDPAKHIGQPVDVIDWLSDSMEEDDEEIDPCEFRWPSVETHTDLLQTCRTAGIAKCILQNAGLCI